MTPDHDSDRPPVLRQLGQDPDLPPALEARVVASLRARGTIGRRPSYWRQATLVAAAVLAAFTIGRATAASGSNDAAGPRWLLLLYEDDAFRGPAPGAEAAYIEEYARWAAAVRRSGTPIEGAELGTAGGLLEPGTGLTQRDPVVEGAGRLTGFFVVTAPSLADVERLAAASPHLRHGGRIGIRQMR